MSDTVFRTRRGRERVTLSVTPLIDVLFLLIIFFAITGTFKRAGELELALPDAATSAPSASEDPRETLEIVVTADGDIRIEGDVVDLDAARFRVRAAAATDAERTVILKAETDVPHGTVVTLLDAVRDAGFRGVSVGTYLTPGQPPADD